MDEILNDLEKFVVKIRALELKDEKELITEFIKKYNWDRIELEKIKKCSGIGF